MKNKNFKLTLTVSYTVLWGFSVERTNFFFSEFVCLNELKQITSKN